MGSGWDQQWLFDLGRKPTLLQEFPMDDARREDDYEMTSH